MGDAAPTLDDDLWALWSAGHLSWLLHDDQMRVYEQYREWERQNPETGPGTFRRIFLLDIGRRWGKTTLIFAIKLEDCIRRKSMHRYATAFQKDIEEIIDDVSRYVLETCPSALRPQYRISSKANAAGYYFPNGSVLRMVGLDKNPDGLRGRASDGDALSEAAFIKHLRHTVKNVLYPQYQGRPHARMILESSAPEEPDSEYDQLFVSDAQLRGAYAFRTLDDNPMLTERARQEFIDAAGGRSDPECRREYFCERVRSADKMLVPEFDRDLHVRADIEAPEYRDCVVALDPGVTHMCALVFGYWDFANARGVIESAWAERNANTEKVAGVIRETERRLWTGVKSWRGGELKGQPRQRVSDIDARMILDLRDLHRIEFVPARKDDADAALHALRIAFQRNQLLILDRPENAALIAHLQAGTWNDRRTAWAEHEQYGHFDLVAALKYWWRWVQSIRSINPHPPATFGMDPKDTMILKPVGKSKTASTLEKAFGGRHVRRSVTHR